MKQISFFIACVIFLGCNDDGLLHCEKGSGNLTTEERTVVSFNGIEIRGSMDVQLTQDTFQEVVIQAQPNILRKISAWVSSEKLIIDIDGCIRNHNKITVFVTMKDIRSLNMIGSGDFIAMNNIVTNDLDLRIDGSGDIDLPVTAENIRSIIDGSGNIRLKGNTITHEIDIDGSGDIFTFDMNSDICDIQIDGSGDCYVRVNEELYVSIRGSGDVHYTGFPSILNSSIEGSGRLINDN